MITPGGRTSYAVSRHRQVMFLLSPWAILLKQMRYIQW